ncbi:MAG: CRISPR system precrRNA processing endoribonuclease RAMP protein Cas6 [Dehalococcoidales bacterium]|nr:CRISPR system precrRNA processing endoribonuclease RAMP protein Cas6 [Dehalococcoidales bacterium]
MEKFKACQLEFICRSETGVSLPRYNGSTLRGAFFGALRRDFCLNKNLNTCVACPAAEACPICRLVATVDREGERGVEVPRPFALEPVIRENYQIKPGELFTFGITLFGESLALFPYIVLAVQRMGEIGMGNREVVPGRFTLEDIRVINPFTGQEQGIFNPESRLVKVPDVFILHRDVLAYAGELDMHRICLYLLTPLRLIIEGSLVQKITFRIFIQRLLRRLTDLYSHYCGNALQMDFTRLLQEAQAVQVIRDETDWVDRNSYSSRRKTSTPVGGMVGILEFEGDLKPFLPLLVWGQVTHVGKDVTRGNGLYLIHRGEK